MKITNVIQAMQAAIELGCYSLTNNYMGVEGHPIMREHMYMCHAIEELGLHNHINKGVVSLFTNDLEELVQRLSRQQHTAVPPTRVMMTVVRRAFLGLDWSENPKLASWDEDHAMAQFYFCLIWAATSKGQTNLEYMNLRG